MKNIGPASMKVFGSRDSLEVHEGAATMCISVEASKTIQVKDNLVHEHDFVPTTIKKGDCLVRCETCDAYFCNMCGKLLDGTEIRSGHNDEPKQSLPTRL
jgi:hypothetical protein